MATRTKSKALAELEELDQEAKKQKYPNVPDHCRAKTRHSEATANGLTKSVLTWLQLNGHYCSRIQSQGQWNQKLGRFTKSTVRKGIGDVMAVIDGKTVMIEIKVGRDKLSPAQIKTQSDVERSGGIYWQIRTFDQFMTFYKLITNKVE